jgi:serine/threonine protein kinase/TPR repeat protein
MPEQVIFDHYEVMHRDDGSLFELGRGAMGITYKALDANLHIPVALKVINASSIHSEVARQRFVREARAAAKLRHRNVASVFHLGIEGETYFYAMELIDGETVESLIRRHGPLDPVLALRIATQVARALNAAQQHELVHRDIKPSNLMLVHEDDEVAVKVIDFGLAKSCHSADGVESAELTLAGGGFVGTPHFASPEQLEEKEIDVRSDIYSLGVTIWYMLAGRAPFGGSIAQVMSQHLHEPPPLDHLPAVPAPVVALLTRMLAKDPAARPQTPLELRRELEACIEAIRGSSPETGPVALMSDSGETKYSTHFRAGAVVGGEYELIEDQGEGHAGKVFRARRASDGSVVRLILLNPELIAAREVYTQLERELEKVIGAVHRNLLHVYSFERVEEGSFLVLEAAQGFTLVELLRARRELQPEEALLLLKQAAVAVDFAVQAGLKRLDFALHQIVLHLPDAAPSPSLLDKPLTTWPEFVLKLNPLGITRELSLSETWTGEQTIVGDLPAGREMPATNVVSRYVQSLAAVVYESLGGTISPLLAGGIDGAEAPRYVPLAALTEEGNEALRRALDLKRSFSSAQEFFHTLRAAEGASIPLANKVAAKREAALTKAQTSAAPKAASAPWTQPPEPNFAFSTPLKIAVAVAAVALIWAIVRTIHLPETPPVVVEPSPETPRFPTAIPREPASVQTPAPPAQPPDRQALLKARLSEAEKYEAARDWARCVPAYAATAREFPESDTGRVRLEMVLSMLRAGYNREGAAPDFPNLRAAITEAAEVDVISAMMILGEQLRKSEPKEAFNWFCTAAAKGHPPALTQVGLMYSNGAGVSADLQKAVWWFEQANERGDPAGKTCLAECYLYGRGVRKDERRALAILEEAVALGDARAMNLLGTCHHQGIGTAKNFTEAFRLFNEAQALGFLDALGNLGVLYMNGDGVPSEPLKAVEYFQKGAREGNAYCMYLYARCLESGSGVGVNPIAASTWYRKSAELGNPRAIEWCQRNRIPVSNPPRR